MHNVTHLLFGLIAYAMLSATVFFFFSLLFVSAAQTAPSFTSCAAPLTITLPGSGNYEAIRGRSIFTVKGSPVAIAIPTNTQQVSKLVRCAARSNLKVCARSGGHAIDGRNLCDGVLLDLSQMRTFSINKRTSLATLQPGLTLGETLWQSHRNGHWFPAGTCPGVGISGYLLGGGIGPYEGPLGIGCDSLTEVTMVAADGGVVKASPTTRARLFNAMCGVGGGHFGVITEFKMRLPRAGFFDNAVVFRYKWPHNRIGNVLEKFLRYRPAKNDMFVRMVYGGSGAGMDMFGVCFNAFSIAECKVRLGRGEFFRVPGRTYKFEGRATSALQMGAFFGPAGKWGNQFPTGDLSTAYNTWRFSDAGKTNRNSGQSAYLTFPAGRAPNAAWWQGMANAVRDIGSRIPSNRWRVMQVNLSWGKAKSPNANAFAHRNAHAQIHYELGPTNPNEQNIAYNEIASYVARYRTGVYPNYPDPRLGPNYPSLYWGPNYPELQRLKGVYDPSSLFSALQPIVVLKKI